MGIDPQEDDVGRKVLYKAPHGPIEEGVIASFNSSYVFVRFGTSTMPQACSRHSLEFVN